MVYPYVKYFWPIVFWPVVFAFLYWLGFKWIRKGLDKLADRSISKLDDVIVPCVMKVLHLLCIVLITVLTLEFLGANLTAIYAFVGAVAIVFTGAIGLAIKGPIEEIISCGQICFTKPFDIGESLKINGDDVKIKTVTLTKTVVTLSAGEKMMGIPNSKICSARIIRSVK